MSQFNYELKIPHERVAVLIGKEGDTKAQVELETKTNINIDSEEGDVTVTGEDALGLFTSREVIRAIGRGFNPEIALLLLKQDYCLEIIQIGDYVGKSKKSMLRLKGRVIGREGKSRKTIEELTECYISVYGKTIGVVGTMEWVSFAKQAIESLLSGSNHANVYKWLEKKRRELKKKRMMEMT